MLYVFCSCGRLKQSAKEKLLVLSFTGNNENSGFFFNFSLFIVSVGLYAEDHFFFLNLEWFLFSKVDFKKWLLYAFNLYRTISCKEQKNLTVIVFCFEKMYLRYKRTFIRDATSLSTINSLQLAV